jgi:molecular chaperone GrpE
MIIPIEMDEPKNELSMEESGKSEATEEVVDMGPVEAEAETVLPKKETDYLEPLQRLKAEFDNYRKRVEREKDEFFAYAKGRVIQKLLPVLDDLDRMVQFNKGQGDAPAADNSACAALASGIELIHQKTKTILLSEGLEEINPAGKPFDPAFHEAIGMIDADPQQDGLVMDELERGYLLQGKLLRPSRVRVGKAKEN